MCLLLLHVGKTNMYRFLLLAIFAIIVPRCHCGVIGHQNVTDAGTYSFLVDGETWLQSAPLFLRLNNDTAYLASDNNDSSLTVVTADHNCDATDDFGPYLCTRLRLMAAGGLLFDIYFKEYSANNEFYIYELVYLNDTNGTRAPDCETPPWPPVPGFETCYNYTTGAFPSFNVRSRTSASLLGYMTFADKMLGDSGKNFGVWGPSTQKLSDGMLSGPVAIFDQAGNTVLLSTVDNFMTSSLWHQNAPGGRVNWGVMGGVDFIPAGHKVRTVLVPARGINKAFETFGSILRMRYQNAPKREQFRASDITLSHLGYWTDNGAFYYYNTEDADIGQNVTYEKTLVDVRTYSDLHKIPYKYLQLDSWWYYKGIQNGIKEWNARPDIFPNGLTFLSQKTNWPMAAHNRYWSSDNVYDKVNGGKYTFFKETLLSVPDDQMFWNDLLLQGKKWDLHMYEQDWLNIQTIGTTILQTDLNLGERWLSQMSNAAESLNISIQYCMALPRHALQSVNYPPVTQARVSEDYHVAEDQWKIGVTSIFADALGLSPSKDSLWTTIHQPGNPLYPDITEPYPALQSLVATLSTGPVGVGDKLNSTNRDLLLRCCNEDGLILKPSQPAKAIDSQLIKRALSITNGPTGEVWSTYTKIVQENQGFFTYFGILFAANMTSDYVLYPNETGLAPFVGFGNVVFPYNNVFNITPFDDNNPLHLRGCTNENFCLYYVSNVYQMNGTSIGVLGEVNKWVPMSPQRVVRVVRGEITVDVVVQGAPHEELEMTFLINNQVRSFVCQLGASGQATFSTSLDGCTDEVSTTTHHPSTVGPNSGTSLRQSCQLILASIVLIITTVWVF